MLVRQHNYGEVIFHSSFLIVMMKKLLKSVNRNQKITKTKMVQFFWNTV